MNAVFVRKRNESLQWMWACLAGAELLVWVSSSAALREVAVFIWVPSMLAVPLLIVSALIHYVFRVNAT